MALDTSIPLQAQAPQGGIGNFLGPALQLFQLKNMQNQQMQFQQQFAARQAIGPILQQSIDPDTGEVDYDKAFKLAAANPQTAFLAGDLLNQGIQRKQTQANITKTNLENSKTQLDNLAGVATGLLSQATQTQGADGTPAYSLDPGKVNQTVTEAVADGRIPKDMAARISSQLSTDPSALYQSVKQFALTSDAHSKQLDDILGKIETTDTGGATVYNRLAPAAAQPITRVGVQPKTLTPGEAAHTETVINPLTKEAGPAPVGNLFGNFQGSAPPLQTPGGSQGAPQGNPLIGAPQGNAPAPSPRPNALPIAPPSGPVSAPPPGSAEAEKELKETYAPQVSNLAAGVNTQRLVLGEIKGMLGQLEQDPDALKKAIGPGADFRNLVARFASAIPGSDPQWVKDNVQDINSHATLKSMLQDVVIPQARLMFGNASNHGLPVGEYAPFSEAHVSTSTPDQTLNDLLNYYGKIGGLAQLQSKALGAYLDAAQDPTERAAIHKNKYLSQNDFTNGFLDYLRSPAGKARLQQYGVIEGNQ